MTKDNSKSSSLIYWLTALAAAPLLMGADGRGCDVPIGTNGGEGMCPVAACAGLPRSKDTRICEDGTTIDRSVCARGSSGQCGWDFPACSDPPDAGPPKQTPCGRLECASIPTSTDLKTCDNGIQVKKTACAGTLEAGCSWDFEACPDLGDGGGNPPGRACSAVPLGDIAVYSAHHQGERPIAGQGGVIVDGVYDLVTQDLYRTGADEVSTTPVYQTLRVFALGSKVERVGSLNGEVTEINFELTASGASLTHVETCRNNMNPQPPYAIEYTATNERLVLINNLYVSVYARRP